MQLTQEEPKLDTTVQMEAITRSIHAVVGEPRVHKLGRATSVEVEILRDHVRREFIMDEHYIDPAKWQPLIYNFRHYFGLGEELGSTFRAEVQGTFSTGLVKTSRAFTYTSSSM